MILNDLVFLSFISFRESSLYFSLFSGCMNLLASRKCGSWPKCMWCSSISNHPYLTSASKFRLQFPESECLHKFYAKIEYGYLDQIYFFLIFKVMYSNRIIYQVTVYITTNRYRKQVPFIFPTFFIRKITHIQENDILHCINYLRLKKKNEKKFVQNKKILNFML